MDPEDVKEVLFEHCEKESSSTKNNNLDDVVGFLESILVDETFAEMQNDFCSKHADVFSEEDENKLIYTELFSRYTELVETYIENEMKSKLNNMTTGDLVELLLSNSEAVTDDVIEMLASLVDFKEFKSLMLSHKVGQTLFLSPSQVQLNVNVPAVL